MLKNFKAPCPLTVQKSEALKMLERPAAGPLLAFA